MKPRSKDQLLDGIACFWRTATVEKCRRYFQHLNKVIQKIIEVEGEATGF